MTGIPAGALSSRVTIERRAIIENTRGSARGDYLPVAGLIRVSCQYREMGLREIAIGNGAQGQIDAVAILRDCVVARSIMATDRAVIDGVGFRIISAGLPDKMRGTITLQLKKVTG